MTWQSVWRVSTPWEVAGEEMAAGEGGEGGEVLDICMVRGGGTWGKKGLVGRGEGNPACIDFRVSH